MRVPMGLCVARVAGHRMASSPRQAPESLPWIAGAKQGSHRADPEGWLEFQRLLHWYLWNAIREVYIPYAKALSNLMPAKTVRSRRDTSQLLTAINAHTLLHHDLRFAEGGVIQADIHRTPREVPSEILAPVPQGEKSSEGPSGALNRTALDDDREIKSHRTRLCMK
jgi:hypothetical protein